MKSILFRRWPAGLGLASVLALTIWSRLAHASPGELDSEFKPALDPDVPRLTMNVQPDGKIVVEGARARLLRLNEDGSRDLSFASPNLPLFMIYSLVYSSEGNWYVNGTSQEDRQTPTVVRIRHNGELDSSFQPAFVPEEEVRVMIAAPQDGLLYFANVVDTNRTRLGHYVQRLERTGEMDSTFSRIEIDGDCSVLLPMPKGQTLVGGSFRSVNQEPHRNFVLVNADGSIDPTFGSPALSDLAPTALCRDGRGRILVAGWSRNTEPGQNVLTRLLPTGEPDPSFKHRVMDSGVEGITDQSLV